MTAYLLAICLVGGLGAFALAADGYRRFLARRGGRVLDAYAVVLLLALLPGVAVLGAGRVFGTPGWSRLALAVPAGLVVGAAARWADRTVVRLAARRTVTAAVDRRRAGAARPGDAPVAAGRVTPTAGALLLGGGARREAGASREVATARDQTDPRQFPLGTVLAVAVAEEAFYRGALLRAALLPAGWPGPVLTALTVVAFALAHVTFGWAHVLAKAPLGVGAAATTLALGSPAAAIVGHAWFNLSVWRDLRAAR